MIDFFKQQLVLVGEATVGGTSAVQNRTDTSTTSATGDHPTSSTSATSSVTTKPAGILLSFVFSLLLTRGIEQVKSDQDQYEGEQPLVGQFGRCSQTLMNLLLTGKATSNPHDGVQDVGGLQLRGVELPDLVLEKIRKDFNPQNPQRNLDERAGCTTNQAGTQYENKLPMGYLSQYEYQGHSPVGNFYKHPKYPIWILGSETHYTLLWSADYEVLIANSFEEKKQLVTNTFNAVAGEDMANAGMLPKEKLDDLLPAFWETDRIFQTQDQYRLVHAMLSEADTVILFQDCWDQVLLLTYVSS